MLDSSRGKSTGAYEIPFTKMHGISQNFCKFRFVLVCFKTVLFVSVVSIQVRNTEKNMIFFLGFTIQIKKQPVPRKLLFELHSRK